ncbi:hypothetical protein HGRIS_000097 [Hohenbuehelia grisea]|uniref:Saccharopine dehydrogenase NADP binding domain-containing protein n=1 Tax=Hohenbuehelia grisea TaxID=104357 RepID=A0ABR3JQ74_9AGAR
MSTYDILVLGATGFTGKLVSQYLFTHPQFVASPSARERSSSEKTFTFAIGARSSKRLEDVAVSLKEPSLYTEDSTEPYPSSDRLEAALSAIPRVIVDVTDPESLDAAVRHAKVVINTVGPYWRWGTPVVRACVHHGVHHVDLTGEAPWVKEIINQFDYLATKSRAIIVPACGMDSIPSDIGVFLSSRTLQRVKPNSLISSSISAYKIGGGISGGTISTGIVSFEEVPKDKRRIAARPCALSPCEASPAARARPGFRFIYRLPYISPRMLGAFFIMSSANRPIVERSWGLLEVEARSKSKTSGASGGDVPRYGPNFVYDECLQTKSTFAAVCVSLGVAVVGACLLLFSPARWLVKKFATAPGQGPSDETMRNGFIKLTNVTTSDSNPPTVIQSTMRGRGDPGYSLTGIMLSESALSLLLEHDRLPALAKRGGVLTTATAIGDVLIERLEKVPGKRFSFESEEVDLATGRVKSALGEGSEARKTR